MVVQLSGAGELLWVLEVVLVVFGLVVLPQPDIPIPLPGERENYLSFPLKC